jgi:DNA-binding beta-propeller fold protein YncE
MKKSVFLSAIVGILLSCIYTTAQKVMPVKKFDDSPKTHNMHVASDGKYLYTSNGGKSEEGQVSKFTLDGKLIGSYPVQLDMRSIMYNPSDKKLYISSYDQGVYRIENLENGEYSLVQRFEGRSGQCTPAITPDGKSICYLENDSLFIYNLKKGKLQVIVLGFSDAPDALLESTSVAIDSNYIYIWNYEEQIVLAYDMKGTFIKSFTLNDGAYSFSLSAANGLIWVSTDGDYDTGTWYGYDLSSKF